MTNLNYITLSAMTIEQLIDTASELETKVTIYSERDWLACEAYIQKLKIVDQVILDKMVEDDMAKAGETKVG